MHSNKSNKLLVGAGLALTAFVPGVFAADGDFSLSSATAILTGLAVTAAGLVGGIIALSGGMDAYQKIRSFFKRAK